MQGSRNIDILMHIRDYCAEINHTMDTFGRDYDIFVSNSTMVKLIRKRYGKPC